MVRGPVFCPHLGTKFDKGTQWGYPSQLASCYLDAKIPYSPSLAHQQRFCLSDRFPGCFRLVEAPAPPLVADTEEELGPEEVAPRGGRLRAARASPQSESRPAPERRTVGAVGPVISAATPHARRAAARAVTAAGTLGDFTSDTAPRLVRRIMETLLLRRFWLASLAIVLVGFFASWAVSRLAAPSAPKPVVIEVVVTSTPEAPLPPPVAPDAPPAAATPVPGSPAGPTPAPATTGRPGTVAGTDGQGLNLRNGPSATAQRVTTMPEGASVRILQSVENTEGRWVQVSYNDQTGWAFGQYVK
ncbi:MAG: SH3 domain-containing protein [Chloroflexi bacterium]|nr:SH3 domain-containing protein [Chloroflexota bacterium]